MVQAQAGVDPARLDDAIGKFRLTSAVNMRARNIFQKNTFHWHGLPEGVAKFAAGNTMASQPL
jgi:hypothetical protein